MNRTLFAVLLVVGSGLLLLAAIAFIRQVGGTQPVEWVIPCGLMLVGSSLIGIPFFISAGGPPDSCEGDASVGGLELGEGPDV
jgi:hypothetical protein